MARNRMTISVVLELLKSGFDKGISSVQKTVEQTRVAFQRWFAVVTGGALALSSLVRSLKQTALAAEQNRVALKNVTDGAVDFNRAQRFLINTSKTYGQDLLSLTSGYTGFSAAARQANVSVSDQEKIFEAVSKAAATYGLNAERTGLVMLALSQMMSKGKISSEELRRQMGEHLPVAFMAMVNASGLTAGQFEKMMAQGKILSKDILPRFADELNRITANADFDNFITSWAKLKNELTMTVERMDLPGKLKPMIDAVTKLIRGAVDNVRAVIGGVIGLLLTKPLRGFASKVKETQAQIVHAYEASASRIEGVNASIAASDVKLQQLRLAENDGYTNALLLAKEKEQKGMTAIAAREAGARANIAKRELAIKSAEMRKAQALASGNTAQVVKEDAVILEHKAKIAQQELLINTELANKKKTIALQAQRDILTAEQNKVKIQTALKREEARNHALIEERKVLDAELANAHQVRSTSKATLMMRSAWITLGNSIKLMWLSVKSLITTSIIGGLMTAIGALIGMITDAIKKSKEAIALAREVERISRKTANERARDALRSLDADGKQLIKSRQILEDKNASQSDKAGARAFLENTYRIEGATDADILAFAKRQEDYVINKKKEEQLADDIETARRLATQLADKQVTTGWTELLTTSNDNALNNRIATTESVGNLFGGVDSLLDTDLKSFQSLAEKRRGAVKDDGGGLAKFDKFTSAMTNVLKLTEEYSKLQRDNAKRQLALRPKGEEEQAPVVGVVAGGVSDSKEKDPIAKAEQEYIDGLRKAKNQYEAGVKAKKEYDDEVAQVSKRYVETLSGLLGAQARNIANFEVASKVVLETSDEFNKLKASFIEDSEKLNKKLADGIISGEEYATALASLSGSYVERIYDSLKVGEAERVYAFQLLQKAREVSNASYATPKNIGDAELSGKVSGAVSTYDGSNIEGVLKDKTAKEISGDVALLKEQQALTGRLISDIADSAKRSGIQSKSLDKILAHVNRGEEVPQELVQALYDEGYTAVVEDLQKALKAESSVSSAVKIGETIGGIKKAMEDSTTKAFSSIKSLASSSQGIVRSLKSLRDVLEAPDATGWERMINMFNTLLQLVNTFNTLIKAINGISEALSLMGKASEAAADLTVASGAKEVATSKAVASSKATEMATKTTTAYAGIPFAGLAIAGAVIAGMVALITSVSGQFARGGIVGGHSYSGDNVMALVNSGEMILNRSQQARLFELANRGAGIGVAGTERTVVVGGTITAKADKLRMVLRKEAEMRRRL